MYATKDIVTTAMFLGEFSDFTLQTGVYKGVPEIVERIKGALELAYGVRSASIYYLSPDTFKEGQTSFSTEIVSDSKVKVIKEVVIENALEYILNLERKGKIKIYRFPNLPKHLPDDKSDIIDRGVRWTLDFGDHVLDQIKQYHPDVLEKVINILKEKGYKPR